jgi:acetyl esterase
VAVAGDRSARPRFPGGATPMSRADYAGLTDRETWAFVERTNDWFPPETIDLPIGRQRAIYDAMCRAFHAGHPPGVRTGDERIDAPGRAIPIRRYRAAAGTPAAMIVYFHGGGFILGGLDSHDDICAELCAGTGYEVVSVDYRLTPEHRHPAAFDDARTAFTWMAASGLPVLLCGESAGGNLAAAVAHAMRGCPRTAIGQVLIYPSLGGDMSRGSYVEHAAAPLLTAPDVVFYRDVRFDDRRAQRDATAEPLCDRDFSGLPPTLVVTAQCDPLSSDGEVYRDRIVAAEGRAWWREEPGLVHGFLRARHRGRRAGEGFARLVAAITKLGKGECPY